MDQALTTTIDQLQQETTEIETVLPRLPILITNIQNYHCYCTSRLAETRHTINHLQAVRAVITTLTPRPSVTQYTTTLNPILPPPTCSTPTVPITATPSQPKTQITIIPTSITSSSDPTASTSIASTPIAPPPITAATIDGTSNPPPTQATSTTNGLHHSTYYAHPSIRGLPSHHSRANTV